MGTVVALEVAGMVEVVAVVVVERVGAGVVVAVVVAVEEEDDMAEVTVRDESEAERSFPGIPVKKGRQTREE